MPPHRTKISSIANEFLHIKKDATAEPVGIWICSSHDKDVLNRVIAFYSLPAVAPFYPFEPFISMETDAGRVSERVKSLKSQDDKALNERAPR
jgi:hypothetical protein